MVMAPGYIGPANVPTYRMASHMQYRGFAVLKPDDSRWFTRYNEQEPSQALFRFVPLSTTHSFFASVRNERIAISPANPEEFKKYIDARNTAHGPRNEPISYESEVTTLQGQWCVRFKVKVWDKAAENSNEPLLMTIIGFSVIHPSWERTIISAEYSERGKKEEITGELDKVGEDFLAKVVLESAPGKKIGD